MRRLDRDELHVVRVLPEDLERVFEGMPRTNERTKEWMRAFFVEGKTTMEIARIYGVEPQHVGNKIRTVRARLKEQTSPLRYVQATLSLPIVLCQELQGLATELAARGSFDVAERTLQPVIEAVIAARQQLKEER
ncbi:sigma-70 family RNA polymerase sigma factor (plasmid) [Paracidovorax citrulli]|uniref:sigma-70 family RNA polymerase sigma factor n=1 Tax=Paracidovorax citrulli TaxID=80869 RepID=UPI000A4DC726|nr:sigma-70 family RNA polymerase sigma factor [Paracidovorax citrulli]UMT93566.1 sigma-70 family RNA polymerase sigma factor [Paracidovorax citrulli]